MYCPSPNFTQNVNVSVKDDTTPKYFQQLIDLACFLKQNIEENKHNGKQLAVLRNSLTKAFECQKAEECYRKKECIPRTWTDLNQYTMFL